MSGLQVSVWKRYGHDRLYVNAGDGSRVAWYDRKTGELHLSDASRGDEVLDALAPYVTEPSVTVAGPPAPQPPAPPARAPSPPAPEHDLAANRPGDALRPKLAEVTPGVGTWLLAKLLGRRLEADSWRRGLAGERKAGAELERLTRAGWRVLHSIPLPRDVDIDHLLIGPGGAFCANTKCHRDARIRVGDAWVRVAGQSYPYVRKSRAEGRRASRALTRACGFPVTVRPVLAFVDARSVTVAPSLRDVGVVRDGGFAAYRDLAGVWTPAEVETVHSRARDARTWAGA